MCSCGSDDYSTADLAPFPVEDQLHSVDLSATASPFWPEALLLGFQHYLVMLGTTVLVATTLAASKIHPDVKEQEKARLIQTLLFVAGVNTLLQSLFGTRLPAVLGCSTAYLVPALTIIDRHETFEDGMRAVQGALLVAAVVQMILGFSGAWRCVIIFLSPLAAVPVITLTGLVLFYQGFTDVANCVGFGLPALVMLVFCSQYMPHIVTKGGWIFKRFSVLITVVIVWFFAYVITVACKHRLPKTQSSCLLNHSGLIGATPWVRVPKPFHWGWPTFHAGDVFAMMAASFVALVESSGTLIAVSRFAKATPIPPSVFSRGVGWQGVAILMDGIFGSANGSQVSLENAGLLGLTRVGSRSVIQISAIFMLIFSILGKVGVVLASIPLPIVAALHCILFAYVASAGLSFLQFCNLNTMRTKFILGFSLLMGISVPQYFKQTEGMHGYGPVHTHSRSFNDIVNVIFSSPGTVAAIIACFLDNTLLCGNKKTRRDSGLHSWGRFRKYEADARSQEFFSLPCCLACMAEV